MVSPLSLVVFHLMHLVKRVNYGTGINIFADYIFCVCVILYHSHRASLIDYNSAAHCTIGKLWKQMAFHGG